MKRIVFAAGLAALTSPAFAGPMEAACLAGDVWDDTTCACIQGVADKTIPAERQEVAAAYFQRKITSQQIAEQHGASFAEELLNSFADFSSEATTECGAP